MIKKNRFFGFEVYHPIRSIIFVFVGSFIYALGIQWFLAPASLYTGGFAGIAQIISDSVLKLSNGTVNINMSMYWIMLNLPVFIFGFRKVGRRFTLYSMFSVIFASIFLNIIDVRVFPEDADKLVYAIYGGVLTGIGVSITLKVGASTGGMDIITQYLSHKFEGSFGRYTFIMNLFIVSLSGIIYNWDIALYTIINLFIFITVIDMIHTIHRKITLFIVTDKPGILSQEIQKRITRGITVIPAKGAYTQSEKSMLMIVITGYELYTVKSVIEEYDNKAFTNIIKSDNVLGVFFKNKVT